MNTAAALLLERYASVRAHTEALVQGLSEADCQAQSMPDTSPVKWHLAHVSWFFETFVLEAHERGFVPFDPAFRVLFNSYYNAVGDKHPRPQRGLVTRPGLAEVMAYRRAVDARLAALLQRAAGDGALAALVAPLVSLGLQHEQQHQELIATDFLHLLSLNPQQPAWHSGARPAAAECRQRDRWQARGRGTAAGGCRQAVAAPCGASGCRCYDRRRLARLRAISGPVDRVDPDGGRCARATPDDDDPPPPARLPPDIAGVHRNGRELALEADHAGRGSQPQPGHAARGWIR